MFLEGFYAIITLLLIMAGIERYMGKKIQFRDKLYLSEGISEKKLDKLKRKLEKKSILANVYLIVPAGNPEDQLDILDAKQLAQPFFRNVSIEVIGIASDYDAALKIIEQLVQECLAARGDCKLREYLSC